LPRRFFFKQNFQFCGNSGMNVQLIVMVGRYSSATVTNPKRTVREPTDVDGTESTAIHVASTKDKISLFV